MHKRNKVIEKLRALQPELEKRGIRHAYLIGSVARDQAGPDSDVDIIVDLSKPLGFEFFNLQDFLSEKISARVELMTLEGLRPRVRREAEKDIVIAF